MQISGNPNYLLAIKAGSCVYLCDKEDFSLALITFKLAIARSLQKPLANWLQNTHFARRPVTGLHAGVNRASAMNFTATPKNL